MATEPFFFIHSAGADVYFRVFNESGQAFDFDDNTFKALASCTTPYKTATEHTSGGGTGESLYVANINLSDIHDAGNAKRLVVRPYDNASPADADAALAAGDGITVQFGKSGEREVVCQADVCVKSTQGNVAQLACWLEHGGNPINLKTVGGTLFTADAGADTISHSDELQNDDVLLLTTDDTLPAGLSVDTPYYVVNRTTSTAQVATSQGGSAINITDTGTGAHKWHRPTATMTLREHGSGVNKLSQSFDASHLYGDGIFEAEYTSPGFTDDRLVLVKVEISENGNSYVTNFTTVAIG